MARQYTNIQITKEVYERVKARIDQLRPRVPVSYYVENVLLENIETDDLMKYYGPFLSYVSNNENTIFINDWKQQRIAGVRVQMKQNGSFSLFCELDQTENCVHVGFVFALPQFYRILKEKGIKPK
ncbi:MAG: hypothetical protein JRN26_08450 [Nitrososphaerota archaeon]|jgi:hypothetical protein|nr:hypothetical protein [Nitrososphaerota archaeon]MDG6936889.1 hypothetical protein [Nitrososphaerota archaeon]MDG6944880.1 hypothetical protein [Nitrososphaerota archaeon]